MKRYPEYKKSCVEWIGEIPRHWEMKKIKNTQSDLLGGVWGNEPAENENDIYCIRVADFNYEQLTISIHNLTLRNIPLKEKDKRILKNYDLLVEKSGGGEKSPVGKTVMFNAEISRQSVTSNFITKFTAKSDSCFPKYVLYCLCFFYHIGLTRKHIKQTTGIQNLDIDSYFQEGIPLPSLVEQVQIANFLDRKTEQIDQLIRIKEKQIELLQEQRTALINQAVTKGLDPNVEMKPSSVEWIGEIPRHWETVPIKHTLQIAKDSIRAGPFGSSLKSHEFQDKGIRVYNQQSVYNEDFSKSDIFISEEKFDELRSFIVEPKDVLITSRGTIGKMTIVPKNGEIGVLHPCLIRIRLNENKLIPKYLWWYVNHSSFFIESVKIASNSTTIDVIYTETLSNVKIPFPTMKEQLEILEFLSEKIPIIDTTISNDKKKIELLKEYRQSLISEAVTGKIDVRNEV